MLKRIIFLLTIIVNLSMVCNADVVNGYDDQQIYLDAVQKKVEQNWLQPLNTDGRSASFSFKVDYDGSVYDLKVLRTSGDKTFDKSAISAILKSAPFNYYLKGSADSKPVNVEFFFSPLFTSANYVHEENLSHVYDVSNMVPNLQFCDYLADLQTQFNLQWHPKTYAKQRDAVVNLLVDKDGSIERYYILKTSHNRKFDRNILKTIANSVPLKPFPDNMSEPRKEIQLRFSYDSKNPTNNPDYTHFVTSSVINLKGYESYTKQVQRIIENSFKGKRYFVRKDIVVEIRITRVGKLNYVKIIRSNQSESFNRKVLAIIQKTAYPPIPETLSTGDITLRYELITQVGPTLKDFWINYVLSYFTSEMKAINLVIN